MKCVKLKGEKELVVSEMPEPIKKDGELIVEVKKAGICGSDIHNWFLGKPEGLVLGHEFCGIVVDAGNTNFKVGDRVTSLPISPCGNCQACQTGNLQYCRQTWADALGLSLTRLGALAPKIRVRSDMTLKVPDNISDEEVAMVEPTAVGLHAINLADIKIGDKVLVIGAGIIGLVSAMFAKKAGASLVAISETNMARAKKAIDLGDVDKYYDATSSNIMQEVMSDTKDGFDVIIECCGNEKAVSSALTLVKPGGTVVLVGVATKAITVPMTIAVTNELTLKGAIAYTKKDFKTCINLMVNKEIDVLKFVSDVVSLNEVQKAYERLTSGTDDAIKILVDPNKA